MDLTFSKEHEEFRAEARAFLEANVPQDLPPLDSPEGFPLHVEWDQLLFDNGWAVVDWPEQYGGRSATLLEWLIFEEEYYRAGGPQRASQNGIFLLAPTLMHFGTEAQKERYLRKTARAEILWCQGWSEPGAGSDLASLTSRAEKTDGGWRLYGAKTWTTRGTFSHKTFGLFRTDPESLRHRGLTYFMVDLDAPGIEVRPINKLDGDEGFAEVYFDGVFAPDEDVLGDVGKGWNVAMATTGPERGLTLRSPGRFCAMASRLVELARSRRDACDARIDDAVVDGWMRAEAFRKFGWWTERRIADGIEVGSESSIMKLHWSHLDIDLHETALEILGPDAETEMKNGEWMKTYLFGLANPIWGGTSEIQRNVVAERILGLPRK